jgi:L-alanine-DL-glutamate epimerase-like enolase superfamily enzyme
MNETICRSEDVAEVAAFVDGINVKIQKSGRLERTVEALETAKKLGLLTMIGCMIESSVGIATACQLTSLADYIDLDGRLLVESDPFTGLEYEDTIPEARQGFGHGVTYA